MATMSITFERHFPRQSQYGIRFFDNFIFVTVTHHAPTAASWLRTTFSLNRRYRRRLVVGVGVQWNPLYGGYTPAHTLQLCVGTRCLIFQLAHADSVPPLLRQFLLDRSHRFVGFNTSRDAGRLMESEHRVEVNWLIDLRYIARDAEGRQLLRATVSEMAAICLGYEGIRMQSAISRSIWDAEQLSTGQVMQAAVEAHLAFLIGREYRVWEIRRNWQILDD